MLVGDFVVIVSGVFHRIRCVVAPEVGTRRGPAKMCGLVVRDGDVHGTDTGRGFHLCGSESIGNAVVIEHV